MRKSWLGIGSFAILALCFDAHFKAHAEDWPMWRGPRGDGIGQGADVPLTWSSTENIRWKVAIPGDGRSSPIVCKDSVFVTTSLNDTLSRRLIRIDREAGKVIWDIEVHQGPIEKQHRQNTSASSTPATDGERIYCAFVDDQKMVVSALDWDGKIVWSVSPGSYFASHGFAASPVLCDGGVLINGHQDGGAFVVLLDGATGKEKWRYKPDTDLRSFSTPVLATIQGSRQVILTGAKQTVGLDPESGERIWWVDGPTEKFVCTPSIGLGHIFSFGGSPSERAFAIRQGGRGDLTKTNIVWTKERSMPYVPTPLLFGQFLHVMNDAGIYSCVEPLSGDVLKTLRKGSNTYSSPVGIGDKVYFFDDTGLCTVIRNGADYEVLARNALDELVQASPAISDGAMYVRGERHVWKIASELDTSGPIVIAHRGASGYAIEHTEAAKTLAHAQGADYIEQDVVLSKDGEFIVTHDITMEETTNVEELFPMRARGDGRFYFADFHWAEIQSLTMHERTGRNSKEPAIQGRFPNIAGQRVHKLADEIQLIRGLNKTTGKTAGLYIELKGAAFHKKEFGYSMGESLLKLLAKLGIEDASYPCYIQCFEPEELKDLHERLHCKLPLIQLLGRRPSDSELASMAGYAKGIGPALDTLATRNEKNEIVSTGFVELAKKSGLLVHPYTVRTLQQPRWSTSLDETHRVLIDLLKVDGFFTDFPDLGRKAVGPR